MLKSLMQKWLFLEDLPHLAREALSELFDEVRIFKNFFFFSKEIFFLCDLTNLKYFCSAHSVEWNMHFGNVLC